MKAGVFIEFDNKERPTGQPLPKGIIRVYKKTLRQRPVCG